MGPSFPVRHQPRRQLRPDLAGQAAAGYGGVETGRKTFQSHNEAVVFRRGGGRSRVQGEKQQGCGQEGRQVCWARCGRGRPVPGGSGEAAERRGAAGRASARRSRLVNAVPHKPVLHGEERNFADIMQIKLFHKAGAVGVVVLTEPGSAWRPSLCCCCPRQ